MAAEPTKCMKELLDDNWDETNTDNHLPKVANMEDPQDKNVKDYVNVARDDYIKIYEVGPEGRDSSGIGAALTDRKNIIAIDIMCGISKNHAYKVKAEALKVIEDNLNAPGDNFQYIDPKINIKPFSGTRLNRLWRWVIEVTLVQTGATLGS